MIQQEYSRARLTREATLSEDDFVEVRRCRRPANRLGFAYQMVFARLHNRLPEQQPLEIDEDLLSLTAKQLEIDRDQIGEYAKRQPTVSDHQIRIRCHLGSRPFGAEAVRQLEEFIFEESRRVEQAEALLGRARQFLRDRRILLPADYALHRIIGEQRRLARQEINRRIDESMSDSTRKSLDDLLNVPLGKRKSPLQRLKANPSKASPDAILALANKIDVIRETGALDTDLSWLGSNYQRSLYHYVRACTVHRLKLVEPDRRYASLECFLWQSYRDALDQLIDMFDKLMTRMNTKAEKNLDKKMREQRKSIKESIEALQTVGDVLLDKDVDDTELRSVIFGRISEERLGSVIAEVADWVTGKKSDVFHSVVGKFSYLRRFSPELVRALALEGQRTGAVGACVEAVDLLKAMNEENKRTLPEDAPLDFIPDRLMPIVRKDDGSIDRHAWETALMFRLRDELKSGNVHVPQSKRFGRFEDYFIPEERWNALRDGFFRRAGLPSNSKGVAESLENRLNSAYDLFLKTADDNAYAVATSDGWQFSKDCTEELDSETQQRVDNLKLWLSKRMRQIRLVDLLIEVDNQLGFTSHFLQTARQQKRDPDDITLILAATMAHGCNIGPYTMAQLTKGVSYRQLKKISDWNLTPESQRAALACLVHAISHLDTTLHWGDGKASASDGQRFSMRRKVLQQTYSLKFSDFAMEFYSFVADNYAPFYSTPIECTDRDSGFVLDGVLYNESDLDLEEHYTDTHGYTDINFAAFAMLGRRFCPRIKGLRNQRIYRINTRRDYGSLASIVRRSDRKINPRTIVEQWDRMGHFYASLECGHTSASVALRRLVGYSENNHFYRANRDLGRIFKTEFLLSYLSEPELRSRIRRGLLKVEQLHALARDVYYARRGRINVRELHQQVNSCSCLTLILACIIYWQAKEISRVVSGPALAESGLDPRDLAHISPIEWDNVILYGEYVINRRLIRPTVGP